MACHRLFALRALRLCGHWRGAYNNLGRPDKLAAQAVDASAPDRARVCLCTCLSLPLSVSVSLCVSLCVWTSGGCSAGRAGSPVRKLSVVRDGKRTAAGARPEDRLHLHAAHDSPVFALRSREVPGSKAEGPRAKSRENYANSARFRLRDQTCLSYGPCQTPTLWFCWALKEGRARFRHKIAC